jgi:hypothetical protein
MFESARLCSTALDFDRSSGWTHVRSWPRLPRESFDRSGQVSFENAMKSGAFLARRCSAMFDRARLRSTALDFDRSSLDRPA